MIKIVVADSHPIVHKGIKAYFSDSTEISIVGKALTARELFSCLESKMVDVIVLEMDLHKSDGLAVLRRIKEEQPGVRVLIFSNQPEEVYAISSLKAGASGYINKKEVLSTLRDAILKIASGGVFITNELAQSIAFDESTGRPRRMFKKLSMREVEVLKMLCDGKRNKDIAFELKINEKTVSTYRSRIMKKLLVRNLVELVRKAQSIHIDSF
ncbi:MAG: response regulator transcription factor [Flavobacteriaceae bacterium]|jgi:DNA-binding NarL/FixJ family response regulator|nr:response regulator transcription factor [Flavobacteriaceae bacterium]